MLSHFKCNKSVIALGSVISQGNRTWEIIAAKRIISVSDLKIRIMSHLAWNQKVFTTFEVQ